MQTDFFSRCHPAVTFAFFIAAIVLSVVFLHPMYILISLLAGTAYLLTLRRRRALKPVLGMIPLFLLVFIVSPLLNPLRTAQGGHVVLMLFDRYITAELLLQGAMMAAMFIAMLLWFLCYSDVMTSDKFTALFAPLLPVLSLMLVMILRLVPAYGRKAQQIAGARRCVGLGGGASRRQQLRGGMATLGALTAWALEGGIITADSMRSRGYGAAKRTNFQIYRFTVRDGAVLLLMAALCAAVLVASAGGCTEATFVPTLYIAGSNTPLGILGLAAWAVFLLLPTLLHLWEDLTWHFLRSKI